jgi:hypothetical protein
MWTLINRRLLSILHNQLRRPQQEVISGLLRSCLSIIPVSSLVLLVVLNTDSTSDLIMCRRQPGIGKF